MSYDKPPKIMPGIYYKPTGIINIDGKQYKTVSLERDLYWKHLKKPVYKVIKKDLL